jgi:hypothetical protein
MIKLKWNFPDFHIKEKNETLEKMRKYGLHASEVCMLEEVEEL